MSEPKWSFHDSAADRARLRVKRPAPVRMVPAAADDTRPRAAGRESCPYCSARGDLGCDHFAPCDRGDLPRQGGGILLENAVISQGAKRRFTPVEDATILRSLKAGMTQSEIAAHLGRKTSSVHAALKRMREKADG